MVARAVAAGDAKHASKKDVELLKKLCVEFKDELAALGAKADKLDKRVTKLEKGIGSWQISGRFRFNANFTGGDNGADSDWTKGRGKYNITRDTARMFFRRQITEDTYFDSQFRLGSDWGGTTGTGMGDANNAMSVRKFYVGTKLPFWGLSVKIGRSQFDWEGEYGLANDEDSFIGDWRMDGFWFTKKWNKVQLDAVIGRNSSGGKRFYYKGLNKDDHMLYSVNLKWNASDKLTLGAMAYWMQGDNNAEASQHANAHTYGVTLGYKFTDGIALKGVYYWQKYSEVAGVKGTVLDDNQYAFKAILDIKQSLLKFTDLWVEYAQYKNGFGGNNGAGHNVNCYAMGGAAPEVGIQWVRPINNEITKLWFIKAEQTWNKKWSTFVRASFGNWGTDGWDNAKEWGLGIKYKLNPAITFMLAYDSVDYGDVHGGGYEAAGYDYKGKDNVLMFQTDVKF